MVWWSLSNITFSEPKQLLVGYRFTESNLKKKKKKNTEFDSKVLHSVKTAK